jgi:hypothetical protein
MDDFIHNLRMGKNRPYDRKRRHYDHSKFKGNAPPSSRGKKGPSGRGVPPDNLGHVKKTLDEIVANQKRLIDIAERKADALEAIAATMTRFCTERQPAEPERPAAAERTTPPATTNAPSPGDRVSPPNDRSLIQEKIRALRSDGTSFESIARRLTAEGIPTLSGRGKWRGQAVQRLYQQIDQDLPRDTEG